MFLQILTQKGAKTARFHPKIITKYTENTKKSELGQEALMTQLLYGGFQFLVPFLTKTADERCAEELIKGHVELLTLAHCVATNVPAMIVDAYQATAKLLLTDGIEVATDGLVTQQATLAATEGTITATHDAGHQFALGIGIGHTLLVDDSLGRSTQLGPQLVERVLYLGYLVQSDGSSGIALLATTSMTTVDVTTEALGDDVGVHDDIAHHEHRRQITRR